jgi:hypothetical protein
MKPTRIPEPNPALNTRWVGEHGAEYAGRWVALEGDRLIVSGQTEAEMAIAARADGAYLCPAKTRFTFIFNNFARHSPIYYFPDQNSHLA